MKVELHPFGEFLPRNPRGMLIGSFPIGKFTDPDRFHEIKPHEHQFFFGGERNLLWRLIGQARKKEITRKEDIIDLLDELGLGVGDVIRSCRRKNGGASDSDLFDIEFNHDLIGVIRKNKIGTVYFTSKRVESWFNKLFPESVDLKKVCLVSPSSQTLRAIGRNPEYLAWKKKHPDCPAMDFLSDSYHRIFSGIAGD